MVQRIIIRDLIISVRDENTRLKLWQVRIVEFAHVNICTSKADQIVIVDDHNLFVLGHADVHFQYVSALLDSMFKRFDRVF